MLVQHFRGLRSDYNIVAHGSGIYFATDTNEILHNGVVYLGSLYDDVFKIAQQQNKNTSDLIILKGTGEGSIKKQIDNAINEFATKLTDDDIVNTFLELVDYAANNKSEIGDLIVNITDVEDKIEEQTLVISQLQNDLAVVQESLQLQIDGTQTAISNLQKEVDYKLEEAFSWETYNV